MIRTTCLVAAFALTILAPAAAHDFTIGALKIDHPWARATPKGATVGGGFFKITNTGNAVDRLIGGAASVSARFEVHESSLDNGVMKMRPMTQGLEIKPGQTIELKPGSYHVMFVGLNKQLEKGDKVKATLQFEKAGKVDVEFDVEAVGSQGGTPAQRPH